MYADAENLITAWLRTQTGTEVGNETPSDLKTDFIRVQRMPGLGDDTLTIDRATLEVDCFSYDAKNGVSARGPAIALAEHVRDLMRFTLPSQVLDGHAVLRVQTQSAPAWLPWDNTNVRRIHATYVVTLH